MPGRVVLVLELTERELLVINPQTLSLFRQLDEMGVRLSIDDFGTGHSSLHYLQQFHVDYLESIAPSSVASGPSRCPSISSTTSSTSAGGWASPW